MDNPKITLGVTAYNVERYLPGALDAALAQDFVDFEIVICDNRSTDRTWEICQAYAERDGRVRIFQNPENIGFNANFRRVVELARGEYFRLTAHDDLMAPTLLSACVKVLDAAGPEVVLAFPQTVIIDGDGRQIEDWDDQLDLRQPTPAARVAAFAKRWNLCNEVFGVVRTEVLRRTRLMDQLDPDRPRPHLDIRMMAELAQRGALIRVPERLFYRRMHVESTFHGDRDPDEVAAILSSAPPPKPRRRLRWPGRRTGHTRLTLDIMRVLWRNELPFGARAGSALGYLAAWTARRLRVRLGRWRRRLTGGQQPVPPWEVPRQT